MEDVIAGSGIFSNVSSIDVCLLPRSDDYVQDWLHFSCHTSRYYLVESSVYSSGDENFVDSFCNHMRYGLEEELVEPSGDTIGFRSFGEVEGFHEVANFNLTKWLDELRSFF